MQHASTLPSYTSGTSTVPLLGDTIGDNLDRTARTFADRDALVDYASGRRWNYRESSPTSTRWPSVSWTGVSRKATAWASGRRMARNGL